MTPHTRMDWVRLRAEERRVEHRSDTVQAMDQITAVYPDPSKRPPAAAKAHDRLADRLTKDT